MDFSLNRTIIRFLTLISIVLVGMASGTEANAQEYPPTIEGFDEVVYKVVDDIELRLWILKPESIESEGARPAVVFFFGGGWVRGTPTHFERQANMLEPLGIVSVIADFRVRDRHDSTPVESISDAKSAIRWVRSHASELGIDPNRIAAAGGSSGGHMAAATATIPDLQDERSDTAFSSIPNALFLFNPRLIVAPVNGLVEQRNDWVTDRLNIPLENISPYHHITSGLPPTLILHGVEDTVVSISTARAYCEKAIQNGNDCKLEEFEGVSHGFFNSNPFLMLTMAEMITNLRDLGWI